MLLFDFQLASTLIQFQKESGLWKRIVQLNLINSIKIILDTLQSEWSPDNEASTSLCQEHRLLHLRLSLMLGCEAAFNKILSLNPEVLEASDDILSLWVDPAVQDVLRSSEIHLQDSSGLIEADFSSV
ncbi:hypothetical protein ARMGADRAFT_1040042 [Armillaria gallica]|uniref:Uncharacterized protein n=1 Tax=Armillaria gallica TaxID=47427 RepID=A0A2H3CWP9_ARMGA|nr:hypothetical protein ARMGADRAFT_1040042 [Armillaria gallica]